MELDKLEKYKKIYKEFNTEIDSLKNLLLQKSDSKGQSVISPYEVSKRLSIPETDVYFLMSLAEKEHLVHRKYQVFTDDNDPLGEFDSEKSIPLKITNDSTGKAVDRDNYYVEIVFELDK